MGRGILFVVIQFGCIAFLLVTSFQLVLSIDLVVQLIAFLLGIWAIVETRRTKISIFPELKEGAVLIQTGPYSKIRHPMYTSVLLFFSPVLFHFNHMTSVFIYLILWGNLVLKLKYEEQLLTRKFTHYKEYSTRSFRLIPFVY